MSSPKHTEADSEGLADLHQNSTPVRFSAWTREYIRLAKARNAALDERDEALAEVERLRETVRMACFDLVMLPWEQHEIMRREPWLEAYEREQNGNTAPDTQEKT